MDYDPYSHHFNDDDDAVQTVQTDPPPPHPPPHPPSNIETEATQEPQTGPRLRPYPPSSIDTEDVQEPQTGPRPRPHPPSNIDNETIQAPRTHPPPRLHPHPHPRPPSHTDNEAVQAPQTRPHPYLPSHHQYNPLVPSQPRGPQYPYSQPHELHHAYHIPGQYQFPQYHSQDPNQPVYHPPGHFHPYSDVPYSPYPGMHHTESHHTMQYSTLPIHPQYRPPPGMPYEHYRVPPTIPKKRPADQIRGPTPGAPRAIADIHLGASSRAVSPTAREAEVETTPMELWNARQRNLSRTSSVASISREPSMMSEVEMYTQEQTGDSTSSPVLLRSTPAFSEPPPNGGGISMTIADYEKTLKVGQLPPYSVCKEAKSMLAHIPIRQIDLTIPGAWHRHFFEKVSTTNPATINQVDLQPTINAPTVDPYTGKKFPYVSDIPKAWFFCRVKTSENRRCHYHKPGSQGTGMRTAHVTRNHPEILSALTTFRKNQGFEDVEAGNAEGYSVFYDQTMPKSSQLTKILPSTQEAIQLFTTHSAIQQRLPFSVVTGPYASGVARILGFSYPSPSPQTVGKCVFKLYGNARARLDKIFAAGVVRGCFTYDGWKRFGRKFIGITFHYIEKKTYKPKSLAIGFEEYFGSGTAVDIQDIVERTLLFWGLKGKAFCSTTDSANVMKATTRLFNQR
ncbi:hypothetical protein EMPS_10542 [Entomortierella parvispora]|uniref:Uncharacterized protein n=1 Tax=Entomortierella parvispora TaxID=205924 RepID=A0A9P3HKR4_9FUNG|nr:hypothetical protein EMPS_10542 [Entomortierella parvispora]